MSKNPIVQKHNKDDEALVKPNLANFVDPVQTSHDTPSVLQLGAINPYKNQLFHQLSNDDWAKTHSPAGISLSVGTPTTAGALIGILTINDVTTTALRNIINMHDLCSFAIDVKLICSANPSMSGIVMVGLCDTTVAAPTEIDLYNADTHYFDVSQTTEIQFTLKPSQMLPHVGYSRVDMFNTDLETISKYFPKIVFLANSKIQSAFDNKTLETRILCYSRLSEHYNNTFIARKPNAVSRGTGGPTDPGTRFETNPVNIPLVLLFGDNYADARLYTEGNYKLVDANGQNLYQIDKYDQNLTFNIHPRMSSKQSAAVGVGDRGLDNTGITRNDHSSILKFAISATQNPLSLTDDLPSQAIADDSLTPLIRFTTQTKPATNIESSNPDQLKTSHITVDAIDALNTAGVLTNLKFNFSNITRDVPIIESALGTSRFSQTRFYDSKNYDAREAIVDDFTFSETAFTNEGFPYYAARPFLATSLFDDENQSKDQLVDSMFVIKTPETKTSIREGGVMRKSQFGQVAYFETGQQKVGHDLYLIPTRPDYLVSLWNVLSKNAIVGSGTGTYSNHSLLTSSVSLVQAGTVSVPTNIPPTRSLGIVSGSYRAQGLPASCFILGLTQQTVPAVAPGPAKALTTYTLFPEIKLSSTISKFYRFPTENSLMYMNISTIQYPTQTLFQIVVDKKNDVAFIAAEDLEYHYSPLNLSELFVQRVSFSTGTIDYFNPSKGAFIPRLSSEYLNAVTQTVEDLEGNPVKKVDLLRSYKQFTILTEGVAASSLAGGALSGLGSGLGSMAQYQYLYDMFAKNKDLQKELLALQQQGQIDLTTLKESGLLDRLQKQIAADQLRQRENFANQQLLQDKRLGLSAPVNYALGNNPFQLSNNVISPPTVQQQNANPQNKTIADFIESEPPPAYQHVDGVTTTASTDNDPNAFAEMFGTSDHFDDFIQRIIGQPTLPIETSVNNPLTASTSNYPQDLLSEEVEVLPPMETKFAVASSDVNYPLNNIASRLVNETQPPLVVQHPGTPSNVPPGRTPRHNHRPNVLQGDATNQKHTLVVNPARALKMGANPDDVLPEQTKHAMLESLHPFPDNSFRRPTPNYNQVKFNVSKSVPTLANLARAKLPLTINTQSITAQQLVDSDHSVINKIGPYYIEDINDSVAYEMLHNALQTIWTPTLTVHLHTLYDLHELQNVRPMEIDKLQKHANDWEAFYKKWEKDHVTTSSHHPESTDYRMNVIDTVELIIDHLACALRYESAWNNVCLKALSFVFDNGVKRLKFQNVSTLIYLKAFVQIMSIGYVSIPPIFIEQHAKRGCCDHPFTTTVRKFANNGGIFGCECLRNYYIETIMHCNFVNYFCMRYVAHTRTHAWMNFLHDEDKFYVPSFLVYTQKWVVQRPS
ncbi:hypothetical protein 2 [Hubei earwig virus 3]|uniref:hypothetical protein 2 n=1 Tax=Hubei earwig virus 3 TaxID=1922892 RepID=UPI00090A1FAB|nr:hypothetical protein 2 [Hubei earwig virus 3]APG76658.1 hypothetical protein 2 [Hubei earwig virus 3]APG77915.1 hypothetical protein 2 [Hubei earwig virus 3]APG77958.1 hypothetical protein 2 [Hubei earwig virus 3]APG77988.1 hypothetical protein 2 [Hubei earwig virus 3]APG78390.1 hypothetical protein 2 [Hubei earwig virus 3]